MKYVSSESGLKQPKESAMISNTIEIFDDFQKKVCNIWYDECVIFPK